VTPVIRRLFRIALRLGLLAGVAFALAKVLGQRDGAEPARAALPDQPWPRLQPDPAAPTAPAPEYVPDGVLAPDPGAPAVPTAAPASKPAGKAKKKAPLRALWVEPAGDVCPTTHPVKAKLASKIFHLPGMAAYERTKPDRCYRDAKAAETDGLRPAKR